MERGLLDSHTRVCKICNKEKPIEDFSRKGRGYYNTKCKVCESLLKKNIDYSSTEWTLEEDRILTGFIINNKGEIINGLVDTLNKDLKTICTRISELRFHTKLTIKVNCEYCGKEMFVTPYRILNYGSICCSKGCNSKLKKGINYHKIINKGSCVNCNKEFDVYDNVPDQKFCSSSCKHQYYSKNDLNRAKTQCANCGKEILKNKSQIRNYNNNYCS